MVSSAYDWYVKGWRALGKVATGTNVFDREWDALVLLDCARADMMTAVADEYPYVASGETLQSVASCSAEWLRRTFRERYGDELAGTCYVSANPNTADADGVGRTQDLVEVWRTGWSDETETVPPRRVTDAAIRYARTHSWDRLIVHYMQPHPPFLTGDQRSFGKVVRSDRDTDTLTFPEALLAGRIDPETGWRRHVENLRLVLDEVDVLRRNVDAERMVVSADHGQAFGEWGIYGHPCGVPVPALRRVPWETTTATDTGTHSPATAPDRGTDSEPSVEEKLGALGYKD